MEKEESLQVPRFSLIPSLSRKGCACASWAAPSVLAIETLTPVGSVIREAFAASPMSWFESHVVDELTVMKNVALMVFEGVLGRCLLAEGYV
jgi:hypothetical protein